MCENLGGAGTDSASKMLYGELGSTAVWQLRKERSLKRDLLNVYAEVLRKGMVDDVSR